MPKEKSPIKILQKEGDTLKKETDAFMEECGLVLDDSSLKDRTARIKKLFKRCGDYRKKCKSLEKKLLSLSKGKEPTAIPNYDEMKDREVERMRTLEVRLEKVGNKLEPDEVEESYFRKVNDEDGSSKKQLIGTQIEELDDEEEEDEEEEEEEDDEEEDGGHEEGDEDDDSKMESSSPEKPKMVDENGDDEKLNDDSVQSKSKFGRMGIFRRSKAGTKQGNTEEDEGKKDKPKEKSDKEKERERKEQEKKDKKEREKLEKERKEKEKKEQKEKEKEAKKKKESAVVETSSKGGKNKRGEEEKRPDSPGKRSFSSKLFSRDSKKPKIDQKTGAKAADDSEEEDLEEEEDDIEEEEDGEDEYEEEEGEEEEEEEEEEKKQMSSTPDKKKGWSLFRRDKSPQRQVKKDNEKDSKKTKEEDKKRVRVQEAEEEEDDEYEDDEDEDEEEYEDELEEEEEEEESEEEERPVKGKQAKRRVESEEEEEEDDEDEDDEEEDDEEDEDEEDDEEEEEVFEADSEEESEEEAYNPPDEGMDLFETVCDFDGEEDDDLSFKRGSILTVLSVREDGWWMAEDEEGNKGLVPSTYLKLKKEYNDFRDVQSPEADEPAPTLSPRSGKDLWRGLKKAVNETGVTDVLSAIGAIPSGFRPSTTARHLKSEAYSLCNFLKPRFTESCLGFQDLNWSPQENQIRAKTVRLQKLLTLMMVRNIPPCGVGIDIRSRHVRICFFDGDKILSNIHTIQATWNKNDPKTWRFSPKVTAMLPSILDGDCFIRSSHTGEKIGLLFELCLSYVRPKTGEKGELSCGWVHLPLFDATTGAPIMNKMYDLAVNGGTPYEQDVEVDPNISRRSSSSKFRAMVSANKQPRLQIKFLTPTKEQKPPLDLLPETLVSSLSYLPFLSFFRKIQADEILRDRIDLQNADLIHCPVLSNFPEASKYPDIMDALRSCWADKKTKSKKIDKRDQDQMKTLFTSAFMDSAFPLLRLPSLPKYKFGDEMRESERWQVISEFLQANKQKGILAAFLAPGGEHTPFDMSEISYNLLDSFQEIS